MPSGNATFTYTGDEPAIYVSGETFTKAVAQLTHDNGVIAMIRERDDFTEQGAKRLSPAQVEALDRVADGELKAGGSPKGGNRPGPKPKSKP